jgi:hypothetical protein
MLNVFSQKWEACTLQYLGPEVSTERVSEPEPYGAGIIWVMTTEPYHNCGVDSGSDVSSSES